MIDFLIRTLTRLILWLRYRIEVRGAEAIAERGTTGILFLPNHPALIDPIILMGVLWRFKPRAVADEDQIDRPVIGWMARQLRVWPFPSVAKQGAAARTRVVRILAEAAKALREGDSLLFYPAGHDQRAWLENLYGNSGTERLLSKAPEARVVLIRTRGLWGSGFSWGSGSPPSVGATLKRGLVALLANLLFFAPRRRVTIELVEPDDVPRDGGRDALNAYLETFYNEDPQRRLYVPYTLWERGGVRELPEAERAVMRGDVAAVPQATRNLVLKQLAELTGRGTLRDHEHLARDLGLDSLARTELLAWLEEEFGFPQGDTDSLQTVGDVLLAAIGETVSSEFTDLKPVPPKWFDDPPESSRLRLGEYPNIAAAFLAQARRTPGRIVLADQLRGARTYRHLVMGVLALKPSIEALEGERVGIMLPASLGAGVVYLATVFAGKTPVMVNWTTGKRNLIHSLDLVGVRRILTAKALVDRLASQGTDLGELAERFVFLEELGKAINTRAKLAAFARSHLNWGVLEKAPIADTAAILFTSGSETLPKAVPLSHANILTNLRSTLDHINIRDTDRIIGFLPPFHSFGLTVTLVLPLVTGMRAVYHANPTEGAALGRLIEAYKATLVTGTPTFLNGILRSSPAERLASMRLAVTGAEKCLDRVYDVVAERCPGATVLEGYGITECSPVVAATTAEAPLRGTVGKPLACYDHLLVDPDTGEPVEPPGAGILHVRGPCVFGGYLHFDGPSPFVEIGGESWYNTGDLVEEDADGVLTVRGRLKRFVKLGGEMISLPAVEAVLWDRYASDDDEGPVLAVEATPDEAHPEIVLFTTLDLDRGTVNGVLRDAGLSALHNIRRVVRLDAVPVLGTGKTDYRALKARLR